MLASCYQFSFFFAYLLSFMSVVKRDDKKYLDGTKQLNVYSLQLPRPGIEQKERGNNNEGSSFL